MSDISANDKRIARNTMFLYFRMGLSIIVSLYTSRVVLQALGVEDYGIYGVVGSLVSMFGFLNASMSGATSRFLTYELGRSDFKQLKKTFSMAFFEHCIIALAVMLICESFGVWFLNYKMVIPPDRLYAANLVLQLSILSMMINVTQVPYNASIISHEHMDIYAYVSLTEVILKLLVVFLLELFLIDKLILYALLVLGVHIIIAIIYRLYCVRHFQECHVCRLWDGKLLKSMLSFSGWDLYGNLSITARTQGVNMLLNVFFGPIVNAAASISSSVQGAVMRFASNVVTAVKPQIIKYYAQGSYNEMVHLISNAVRLNYLILLFITVPLMTELHYVLSLWLGVVPDYTVEFCCFTLVFNFYTNMSHTLVTGIHATGKIIRPSLINGSLYLSVVPITYIAFKLGGETWTPYLFNVIAVIFGMLSNAYTLHLYVREFSFKKFLVHDLFPCLFIFCLVFGAATSLHWVMDEGLLRLLSSFVLSSSLLLVLGYLFLIPRSLSDKLLQSVRLKLCKKV